MNLRWLVAEWCSLGAVVPRVVGRRAVRWAALLVGTACVAASAPAASPASDPWPPVVFTLDLVEALDRRDSIRWTAVACPEDSVPSREAMARLIRAELAATYPPELLRENVRAVHVVRELHGGGKRWGGLHWGPAIVLTSGPDGYVLDALHHELAGLLLERHARRFPRAAWRSASVAPVHAGGDISYLPDATSLPAREAEHSSAEAFDASMVPIDELARLGFVSPYGRTTEDNDIEEYIRVLFRHPARLLELARRHDRVRTKLGLVLGFLEDISGGVMTPEYHAARMRAAGDDELRASPELLRVLTRSSPR